MSFVNDGEIPCDLPNVWFLGTSELVRADDDLRAVEWVQIPRSLKVFVSKITEGRKNFSDSS